MMFVVVVVSFLILSSAYSSIKLNDHLLEAHGIPVPGTAKLRQICLLSNPQIHVGFFFILHTLGCHRFYRPSF